MPVKFLNQRVLSLVLAGGITLSAAGCGNHKVELQPLNTLMQQEQVQDKTLLDELVADGYLLFGIETNILEEAILLERMLEIKKSLSMMDFRELRNVGFQFDREVPFQEITDEEIEELKTTAKMFAHNNKELEQRTNALKRLYAVDELTKEWLEENGKEILTIFMITSVRASVANNLEIPTSEFYRINILDQKSSEKKESYYVIIDNKKYEVKHSSDELWDTIHYMFQLRERTKPIGKNYEVYEKGLELAKMTIASGSKVKKDSIKNDKDSSYVEKHFAK